MPGRPQREIGSSDRIFITPNQSQDCPNNFQLSAVADQRRLQVGYKTFWLLDLANVLVIKVIVTIIVFIVIPLAEGRQNLTRVTPNCIYSIGTQLGFANPDVLMRSAGKMT